MTRHGRIAVFAVGAAGLAALLAWGLGGLPPIGEPSRYGIELTRLSLAARRVQNAVSGVNFDLRATDTLVEELILVTAATGVTVILRRLRDEYEQPVEEREPLRPHPQPVSEPVRVVTLGLVAPVLVAGLALIAHGHLTPGGGFQGGALVVIGGLIGVLGGRAYLLPWRGSVAVAEAAEGTGALAIMVLGSVGVLAGGAFLQNVLPVGSLGSLASGGLVGLISLAVGLAVTAGVALVVRAFLAEALAIHRIRREGPQQELGRRASMLWTHRDTSA